MIGQIYVSCLPVAGLLMRTVGEMGGVRNNAHLFGLPMRLLPEGKREREERKCKRAGIDGGSRLGITLGSTQSIVSAVSQPIITSCTRVYSPLATSSDLTATLSLLAVIDWV